MGRSRQTQTETICPYCGVGCNLTLHVQDNQIVKVTSPADHDIRRGNLCIKGRSGSSTSTRSPTRPTARERRRSGPLAAGVIATVPRDGERDEVAVEEPLEVRVDGEPLLVTMRTPGHDEELALGFLYGEGLINGARKAGLSDDFAANTIDVAGPLARDPGERRFYTTCPRGVCGKGAL